MSHFGRNRARNFEMNFFWKISLKIDYDDEFRSPFVFDMYYGHKNDRPIQIVAPSSTLGAICSFVTVLRGQVVSQE